MTERTIFTTLKKPVNEQYKPITIAELRQCPEFSHLDDALAQNVINSIQEFCSIIANQYNSLNGEDNGNNDTPKDNN